MKKITINDFSGGIQESTVPDDFSSRQWAQLKGIIPSTDLNFESQWPMQTIGSSFTGVHAVYPLVATTGTYLIALKNNGTIWWAKSPAATATYTTANAISWTQLTVAENKDVDGDTISIQANTDYKFVCTLPLKLYKYATTPDEADPDNPTKDAPPPYTLAATSAVMLNSTTLNGAADGASQQVVVVFVDTTNDVLKAITFPNVRRVPLHDKEEGSFIKAYIGNDTYVSIPEWFTDTSPYRAMHPYLYLNIDSALLPGAGIIPRSNVGTMKGGTVLLGDIEWRSDLTVDTPKTTEVPISSTDGHSEFSNDEYQIQWPTTLPVFSRVLYIHDGEVVYFKDDSNMVGTIINYSIKDDVAYFFTAEDHGYTVGETVEISRIGAKFNVTSTVASVINTRGFTVATTSPDTNPLWAPIVSYEAATSIVTITTLLPHGFTVGQVVNVKGVAANIEKKDAAITAVPSPTTFQYATTHTHSLTTVNPSTAQASSLKGSITAWSGSGTVATFTTGAAHSLLVGDTIWIGATVNGYNGPHVINSVPTSTTFTILSTDTATQANPALYGFYTSPVGRSVCYELINYIGEYQPIPNSWTDIWVTASDSGTKLKAVLNLNTATHLLNDANTGPHRNSIYFSTGADIDQFDPRAVLTPGKTDVQIVGMHTLDDTVVVLTTAGSQNDGVYRIRGYLDRLIQYGSESDPNAVRIELVRGGLGAPRRTAKTYRAYSTTWSEAGVVAFIDRLGGVWYTNGKDCDRLDRYGPKQPKGATDNDHVAELGKNLFVWRDGRLLCLTMMDSAPDGRSGSACWTEVNVPSAVSSMIGANQELFFVMSNKVCRMTAFAPDTERACYDNSPLTITVSTLTAGDGSSHLRTNWHKFGMTFVTPTSCTVGTVAVQSTGALSMSAPATLPDVQYTTTLNRTFNNKGILGEFMVNTGIGPQAMCSATITFTGYVQLQSASFWVTGATPRVGDL